MYGDQGLPADPGRYQALGAKIPKGVLLYGPRVPGKRCWPRASPARPACRSTDSGSDFVEMFFGVGASRVRDLFEQAKPNAPCIIFVDEIDAVAASAAPSSAVPRRSASRR